MRAGSPGRGGGRPGPSTGRPAAPLHVPARWAAALTAGLVSALLLPLGLPAAAATAVDPGASSRELRADVTALTAQVEQLEVQAEVAAEAWNEVRSQLDVLVTKEVDAEGTLADAGRSLDADQAFATRRVRALYRSGGSVELVWTALSGSGFAQAASTYRTARVVLDADAAAVVRARDQVDAAVTASGEVQQLRREKAALEAEAAQRRSDAEAALRAREDLLAGTDAALVAAVERERRQAEAAALEAALAQASATAPVAGATMSPEAAAQIARLGGAGTAGPGGGTVTPGTVGADVHAVVERAAATAPSPAAAHAIRAAATRLGMPYVWGATGPSSFDCSGLTGWAYRQAGVQLPRTSRQQYATLPTVPVSQMLPGDLVFYANGPAPSSIHHVSIYLGDGLVLTAPRTGDVVKVSALWRKPLYGAVRPAG